MSCASEVQVLEWHYHILASMENKGKLRIKDDQMGNKQYNRYIQ